MSTFRLKGPHITILWKWWKIERKATENLGQTPITLRRKTGKKCWKCPSKKKTNPTTSYRESSEWCKNGPNTKNYSLQGCLFLFCPRLKYTNSKRSSKGLDSWQCCDPPEGSSVNIGGCLLRKIHLHLVEKNPCDPNSFGKSRRFTAKNLRDPNSIVRWWIQLLFKLSCFPQFSGMNIPKALGKRQPGVLKSSPRNDRISESFL